jgi:hypothetical protein
MFDPAYGTLTLRFSPARPLCGIQCRTYSARTLRRCRSPRIVQPLEQHRLDDQEVTGDDRASLGGQECAPGRPGPAVGFHNSAADADLGFYEARSYSLMSRDSVLTYAIVTA